MMPTTTDTIPQAPAYSDESFWHARIDANRHRATIVPDWRRGRTGTRQYGSVEFSIEPKIPRVLKSIDPTRGVSDVALCASLVAALLAKIDRDESWIVGMQIDVDEAYRGPRPMMLACEQDATVLTLVETTSAEAQRIIDRNGDALAYLPQALGLKSTAQRCPLFDVAIAVGAPGIGIDFEHYPVDIAFIFVLLSGEINVQIRYADDLYRRDRIEGLAQQLLRISSGMAANPWAPINTIALLSIAERDRILHDFNARSAKYPLDRTIHGLFEDQCRRTPTAIAAVHRDVELSYAELNVRANRLANQLLALGLRKGDFVCILLERGCDFLTAVLATFKAGGAYVPLDPTYPLDRISYMLADSDAAILVSNRELAARLGGVVSASDRLRVVISLDGALPANALRGPGQMIVGPEDVSSNSDADPEVSVSGPDRAYMIYTSGSTGRPKGAICRHNGALNHLFGELDGIGLDGPFSFLQTAASSSDISVWQFVAPLVRGGATVIADYDVVVDPPALFALMRDRRLTVAEPVPVVLRALLDYLVELPAEVRALPHLRCMMSTGESLPAELVDRWLALYPQIPIANTYGPTETSDDVTLAVQRSAIGAEFAAAPIGWPLPNVRIFIVDRNLEPVPIGVPGEICVGGVAVGEGYWRQPEKTRTAFVACPFETIAPGSMYRCGDLGRWLPDGQIEFLGRVDQQIKVRGFRVEPGEIETAMRQHPSVNDAAVVLTEDPSGAARLVGYYVLRAEDRISPAELRSFLKESLAEHMVPAVLLPLTSLPRTPLGKLDRKALAAAPHPALHDDEHHVEPRTPTERLLVAIWCEVVGAARVSTTDNFFEIGGDSISTLHVLARLRKAGLSATPRDLFQRPVLASLADYLDSVTPVRSAGPSSSAPPWDDAALHGRLKEVFPELDDAYPLGATQRGIYYQTLLLPRSSGAYIEQVAFDVVGELDRHQFARAWQHVVNELDVLRTAVVRRGGLQPAQVVLRSAEIEIDTHDLRTMSHTEQATRVAMLISAGRARGFDLKRPPLMRIALVLLSEHRARLLWTYHHLILDGWSEGLVIGAVFAAYAALRGSSVPAPSPSVRYRDFVAWSEAQDHRNAEVFWRTALEGFTTPAVVTDGSPAVSPAAPGEILHGWCDVELSGSETNEVEASAKGLGVTFATAIHAAWALLLHRATGLSDVVFGSVASGRSCDVVNIDKLPGLIVATQPLRSRPGVDSTVAAWLRLLQLQMADMREHEHTPLALIQQWCEVPAAKRPLFDSIVVVGNYAGNDLAAYSDGGLAIENVESFTQPLYALTLFVVIGTQVRIRLVYERKRFSLPTATALLNEYCAVLHEMAANPQRLAVGLMRRA